MVPGLQLMKGFVTGDEQAELIDRVDRGEWSEELRRRVQHFGYRYDYRRRAVADAAPAAPLPSWAEGLADRLLAAGAVNRRPQQLIVNEYLPGQGIAAHVDSTAAFGEEIASISLGSTCVITFTREDERRELLLEPGDLLVLRDEARYEWRHEIRARRTDVWEGRRIARDRRLSLTFRSLREGEP
jgi:alkylated DNA repair dioxygenase AlkB